MCTEFVWLDGIYAIHWNQWFWHINRYQSLNVSEAITSIFDNFISNLYKYVIVDANNVFLQKFGIKCVLITSPVILTNYNIDGFAQDCNNPITAVLH